MVAPEQSHLFKITTTLPSTVTVCGFTQVVWLSSQVVNCCPPATSRLSEPCLSINKLIILEPWKLLLATLDQNPSTCHQCGQHERDIRMTDISCWLNDKNSINHTISRKIGFMWARKDAGFHEWMILEC